MARLFSYCLLLTLLATTLAYAGNSDSCPFSPVNGTCNKVENSTKLKTTKAHSCPKLKDTSKPAHSEDHKIPSADTFEKFIAPFIETVAPHFYDKIIKKEKKEINQQNKLTRNC
ncbi:hypothetical protein [Desertivirga arenae]|uniref:hypothetical protein n=1 Tax=Desertivirga arenae TaxID=2810309 RepID=UPI001A95EDED|nr:hypothetical protein [Pedobacter sp. SYSU D00823]